MWLPISLLLFLITTGWCDDTTVGPMFIKEPPNRVDFSNTTGAVIECTARGNPTPEIIWIRPDGTAVGDVPGLRQVLANGNLVFPPFRAEDYRQEVHAQVYICLAKNSVGSIHSRDVNVRAVVDQQYDARVIDEYVLKGNAAILKCLIPSFVADFVQVIDWEDSDGQSYPLTMSMDLKNYDGKYLVLPSGELHIKDVGPEDGHKSYQCRTKHRLTGETRLSATKGRLVITDPMGVKAPTIGGKGSIILQNFGISFSLLCQSQGYPVPTFRWYKFVEGTSKKQPVLINDRVKQVSGTLIIREAKVEDSGKYLCVVNNSVGGESVETVLTVTAPLVAGVEPTVQTVDFGRPALLTCNYEGNPVKTVSWLKDGKVIPGHNAAVLKIDSVRKEDKGMYQCFVRNEQESAQASAELKLGSRFEPPVITKGFESQTLQPGPSVYLKCIGKGNPTPEITWYLDEKKLINTDRLQVGQYVVVNGEVVSFLNITSAHTNDGGLYKCVASSKVGVFEHAQRVNVYGLPFVRTMEKKAIVAGETLIVTCPVAGYPIDSIVWERDGRVLPINRKQKVFPNGTLIIENVERLSDQATYTCVAKNGQGYSSRGTLEVQVMVLPHIIPFSLDEEISYGESAQLTCHVSKGDRPLTITWNFHGEDLSSHMGITTTKLGERSSILTITSAMAAHTGNYTCTATNKAGTSSFTTPVLVHVPPRWIIEPTDKAFAQGSDAKVECKADGFPKPSVTWKRASGDSPGDYKDLKPNNPDVKVEEGTLYIHNIQKGSEGYYLCEAVNGIGSGLSAVIMISVQAPPQFETKFRNQTSRINDPSVLQCEAKGEKPIGIIWNMNNKRLDPKSDIRYTIREEILMHGVLSDLSIRQTSREDSALFTCVATNSFGSDDARINLIVQEVPEAPRALKVLDKSGRSVQLSWSAPYDGNSPIIRYLIEYKVAKGSWDVDIDRVMVPGHETRGAVLNLNPATTYHMRVVAENEVGTSTHSEPVTIITAEEAPSGPPQAVKVEAIDQVSLKVTWKPPEREDWNGEIQGYYVGYKLSSSDKPYLFETVEFSKEEGKEHHLIISGLKTYTQYSVVVQAFNRLGAGPMSEEKKQFTAEGIPEEPPHDPACTTLTSQTIRVSWTSPSPSTANGIIKGYKVIYGPSDTWYDEKSKDSKITSSSETIIHGLKKFTNYNMQILAFTAGGDGVRTAPIHCQTEQDVPDSPTAVKALAMSEESILISWKPPAQPNGIISQYTVYIKEEKEDGKFEEPKSQKMPPFQMTYEASGLNKEGKYEFWVTASTNIGEGQPSKTVVLTPSLKVPARIASFDSKFTATYREDVKLPCLAVGKPAPDITWKIKGTTFESSNAQNRLQQLPEGSLLIKSVTRNDAGEYSCSVENSFGKDSVTHHLVILAPPHVPQVTLTSTTTNSITMKLKPNPQDTEPIHGYTVKYKPEFGDWESMQLAPTVHKYTLENLWCGSRYMISVTAYNSIGTGDESDILNTRTKGSKPIIPEASRFIEVSTNSITLHLSTWSDGGCPMLYFVVEHKKKMSTEWNQVSNNVKPGGNFVVLDLDPATWYNLRVTAHNNAGFAVAEYEFATLTITGGTVSPPKRGISDVHQYFPWIPKWIDLNIVVPVCATIIVIFVGIIVICVALARRSRGPPPTRLRDDIVYNQSMVGGNTIDKRCPDLHDELGYIPPPNRKLPPVPGSNYNTCERVKRGRAGLCSGHSTWDPRRHMYEELASHTPCRGRLPRCPGSDETMYHRAGMDDDICPYATFHLLGFREEMDPSKAMQFQTFPHQNGHCGTLGPGGVSTNIHHRSGSQSMPRNGRYSRVGPNSTFSPEYDDPANCTEDDPYGSQYTPYGAPYDHYSSRNSLGRRSVGSPEPPPPPPRNHDANSSANDSKESNEMSEAECDRDQLVNRNYPVSSRNNSKDGMTTEEMRKLIERNEGGPQQFQNGGLTAYDTVAV